jgi:hypothetical protein
MGPLIKGPPGSGTETCLQIQQSALKVTLWQRENFVQKVVRWIERGNIHQWTWTWTWKRIWTRTWPYFMYYLCPVRVHVCLNALVCVHVNDHVRALSCPYHGFVRAFPWMCSCSFVFIMLILMNYFPCLFQRTTTCTWIYTRTRTWTLIRTRYGHKHGYGYRHGQGARVPIHWQNIGQGARGTPPVRNVNGQNVERKKHRMALNVA